MADMLQLIDTSARWTPRILAIPKILSLQFRFRALFFSEIEIGHSVALLVVGARIEGMQRSTGPSVVLVEWSH